MKPMVETIFLIFLLWYFAALTQSNSNDFIFNGFNQTDLRLEGATVLKPNGALRLTNKSNHIIGRAFYPKALQFLIINTSSSTPNVSSFSTSFVFAIVPSSANRGGHGLAFLLSPSMELSGQADHFLGILNNSNDGNSTNHIFAVEFDTVNGHRQPSDSEGNHVGININSMLSNVSEPVAFYAPGTDRKEEFSLESGDPVQAWIDYDGGKRLLNVTVSPLSVPKPSQPLISRVIELSSVLEENMYVGFSAATGKKSSSHYILAWSFCLNGTASPLDLSKLPVPPKERKSSSFKLQTKAVIGGLSVLIVLLLVALVVVLIYRRKIQYESLEDWELDCPHRFKYKDLYAATKGFKESELLGVGGFGAVYKGVLPATRTEIAVKKIFNDSRQGLREFSAEIESLGRLRHKNLVNLQGWCKRKNDLLLVYDYIPYGSLHSLLFERKNGFALSWEQRFNIIKGVAEGLLYLHEEWEKVVIHRDVKPSNVLIDSEMKGRLGDFGLARLYDHGIVSHTTHVVGTIGYIAPELAQTGKASTRSDVFAYGVLLLEVASGRGPLVSHPQRGQMMLVDWVIELLQTGQILDVIDPSLDSCHVIKEVELVLGLGLVCSHPNPEARPTTRQLMRYLNGDDLLPGIHTFFDAQHRGVNRFWEAISGDTSTSYRSSSKGEISSSSFEVGR